MRRYSISFFALALISTGALAACGDDAGDDDVTVFPDAAPTPDAVPAPDAPPGAPTEVRVSADITADATWSADHFYVLETHIFVRGGTLTIEPGVEIFGENGSSLVVTTAAKISAVGTAELPIRFTSAQPQGSRLPGDWGGVVLLGLAQINVAGGSSQIEGFPAGTVGTQYGGTAGGHDCGRIEFVEIHFGGFELAPNNELNGLTVGACGSATVIDHVHVHMGSDDGVEVFGGTVNLRHIIVTQAQDDGLDWDFGWVGRAQFVIVQQNQFSNQGFESDNNPNNNDSTPRSAPLIYNATLIGSDRAPGGANQTQKAMHLRRGTAGQMFNFVVMSFTDFPVDVDGTSSVAQTPANLFIKNSIFFDNGNQVTWADSTDNDGMFDEGAYFKAEATNKLVDPKLTSALNTTAPNFHPGAQSPALVAANAATPPDDGFFDVTATYIGAVGGADDWTLGWITYPAN